MVEVEVEVVELERDACLPILPLPLPCACTVETVSHTLGPYIGRLELDDAGALVHLASGSDTSSPRNALFTIA